MAPYIVMPFDGPANCGVSGCINPLLSIKLRNNQNKEKVLEIFLINNYLLWIKRKRKVFCHTTDLNTSTIPSNVRFYSTEVQDLIFTHQQGNCFLVILPAT